jgi:hypothetical protein
MMCGVVVSLCEATVGVLLRIRSQNLLVFGGKTKVNDTMQTITPNASYWCVKRCRILTGTELLGLQGFSKADLKFQNRNGAISCKRQSALAGEMFCLWTLTFYLAAVLTEIEL